METISFYKISVNDIRCVIKEELEHFFATTQTKNQNEQNDKLGGVELAIEITGLAKSTIYSLVSERKIPHSKKGKRLYFSAQELLDWLRSGKRKTVTEITDSVNNQLRNKSSYEQSKI